MLENVYLATLEKVSLELSDAQKKFVHCLIDYYIPKHEVPGKTLFDALVSGAEEEKEIVWKSEEENGDMPFRDRRTGGLLLRGFRRFPAKDSSTYYTISFSCDGKSPCSSVFLGANGIGKSSLYGALELFYLQHLYSAEVRGFKNAEEQRMYIHNIQSSDSDLSIKLEIDANWLDYYKANEPLSYPAFFCSERDITFLEKRGTKQQNILKEYLVEQLGFNDLYVLNERLKNALGSLDEKDATKHQYFMDVVAPVSKVINAYLLRYYKDAVEYIKIVFPEILNRWLSENTRGSIQTEVKIESHIEDTNNPFNLEIQLVPKNDKTIESTDPILFLNTFRFKLYCVALKMGLVCCAKKLWNINAPLVIDDVFDSSDFGSRIGIKDFIGQMLDAHDKVMGPDDRNKLQLIFFTQDEIIAESVYKALAQNDHYKDSVRLSSLFSPQELKNSDVQKISIGDDRIKCLKIEDKIF